MDVAAEFAKMIVAQQAYQANAKTGDNARSDLAIDAADDCGVRVRGSMRRMMRACYPRC